MKRIEEGQRKNPIERLNRVGWRHLNCSILNCNHKLQQKLVCNNLETNNFPPKKTSFKVIHFPGAAPSIKLTFIIIFFKYIHNYFFTVPIIYETKKNVL